MVLHGGRPVDVVLGINDTDLVTDCDQPDGRSGHPHTHLDFGTSRHELEELAKGIGQVALPGMAAVESDFVTAQARALLLQWMQ
jgi:hypothetical protein